MPWTFPDVRTIVIVVTCAIVAVTFGPEAVIVWISLAGSVLVLTALYRAIIRRERARVAVSFAGLVALAWILVLSPGAAFSFRRLSPDGFEQVRVGMSLDHVEKLIGGPPGNYGANSQRDAQMTNEGSLCQGWRHRVDLYWTDDRRRFEVCFDESNHVLARHERIGYSQTFTILGRVGRLFGVS